MLTFLNIYRYQHHQQQQQFPTQIDPVILWVPQGRNPFVLTGTTSSNKINYKIYLYINYSCC